MLKYLRVFFPSEGRLEQKIDRAIGVPTAVVWTGEERAESKMQMLCFLVNPNSYPHLKSGIVGRDQNDEIAKLSTQ